MYLKYMVNSQKKKKENKDIEGIDKRNYLLLLIQI